MRAAHSALLAALAAIAPAAARADPPPHAAARLEYKVGAGIKTCPPESFLRAEVSRRMGYELFTPDASLRIVTAVHRAPGKLIATIEAFDSTGAEQWGHPPFESRGNCADLVVSVAIAISAMLARPPAPSPPPASSSSSPPPPEPPAPSAPASPAPPPSTAPVSPPASRPPHHRSWGGEVGLGPLVAFGTAPSPAFGGALSAGLLWPSVPLSIAGELHLNASATGTVNGPSHARVKTFQIGGALVPCWRPLFFLVCGVATYSEWYGTRTDISPTAEAHNASFRIGLRGGLGVTTRYHVGARLYGDLLGTLKPVVADISGGETWRTSPVSGDVGIAVYGAF